jgi:hypothetical protein
MLKIKSMVLYKIIFENKIAQIVGTNDFTKYINFY